MSIQVNSSSLKSNKSFIGTYRGIVTRCPSYEPDPEGENKIQVCIPSYHGAIDNNSIGSGSNPGLYPWARMCFTTLNNGSSSVIDATNSGGTLSSDISNSTDSPSVINTISKNTSTTISGDLYTPRLSFDDVVSGSSSYKYYYTDNVFYKSGYGLPNCTCYAWGRAYEILGSKPNLPTGDAGSWVANLGGAYPVSKDNPQLGDVCCWSGGSNGGHVAVIESIDGDTATISESAWQGFTFNTSTISKSNNWGYGSNYTLNGFIHIGNYGTTSTSSVSIGSNSSSTSIDPYPQKGDVVWVTFEGGDIRYPIIVGALKSSLISIGDSSTTLEGGTLAKLASDIIIYEEVGENRVYDSIVGNDNGGLSIGLLGFHEDRARDIIKEIYNTDRASFYSAAKSYELSNKLKDSWAGWVISEGTSIYTSMKRVLGINTSKIVQDEAVIKSVQGYIDEAKKLGITDNGALIYAADLHNQGGLGALQMCYNASAKPVTLVSLHNGAMTTYMGNYSTRRCRVYSKIKQLESSGKLTESALSASGQAAKVVAIAKKEIGYKASEHGGATKYGQWFSKYSGWDDYSYAPWCAMFTQWCMYQAGLTKNDVSLTASAGESGVSGWKSKGLWHNKNGFTPKPGDLIHYTYGHVGIVESCKNGKVYTIEGNTGSSPGCVGTHEYSINKPEIAGYARPNYK